MSARRGARQRDELVEQLIDQPEPVEFVGTRRVDEVSAGKWRRELNE